MTYLFLVIGISVINALVNKKISYAELLFANLVIVFVTFEWRGYGYFDMKQEKILLMKN